MLRVQVETSACEHTRTDTLENESIADTYQKYLVRVETHHHTKNYHIAKNRQCVNGIQFIAEYKERLMISNAFLQRSVTPVRVFDRIRLFIDSWPQIQQPLLQQAKLTNRMHVQ